MENNYIINDNFRKILLKALENPFGSSAIADFENLIPFESPTGEEIFIEDGRCFVRHNNNYATYFYTDGKTLDNYELIKRIVMKYGVSLNSSDERSKQHFIDEVKMLLMKTKW